MATSYDLNLTRGSDFAVRLTVKDTLGNLYNLSGYTTTGLAKFRYGASGSLLNLNASVRSGFEASGHIDLSVTASQMTGIPVTQGVYDVEIYSGTYHEKVIQGYVNVFPEVTRPSTTNFNKTGSYL